MMKATGSECKYLVNPGEYMKSDYSFALHKESPLREIFDFHTRNDFFHKTFTFCQILIFLDQEAILLYKFFKS